MECTMALLTHSSAQVPHPTSWICSRPTCATQAARSCSADVDGDKLLPSGPVDSNILQSYNMLFNVAMGDTMLE
jgi:hypothetical protein